MSKTPPKYLLRFFRWFCHQDYVEDIEGDLLERFRKRPSKWLFTWEVVKLLRPGIIKFRKIDSPIVDYSSLIRFHFKTGFRNLKQFSLFSTINTLGLSVSIMAIFCIYQYVRQEYQTDRNFTKKDSIYRLVRKVEGVDASYQSPTLAAPYFDYLISQSGFKKEDLIRVFKDDELVSFQKKSFFEENFFYVDQHFFNVFDFEFLHGNANAFLNHSNAVVLSERTAHKFFGTDNPIGKLIKLEGKGTLKVIGVLANRKHKSHLEPDLIAPISSMGYTSRMLKSKEFHAFSYYATSSKENLISGQIDSSEPTLSVTWQPLSEIYFDEEMQYDIAVHGDKNLVDSLLLIGLLIFIVSGANFFNTLLTSILRKIKDLGVRKAFGSNNWLETLKILIETYIVVLIAVTIAILGGSLLVKTLKKWYGTELSLQFDLQLTALIIGFSCLLTFLFVTYPALIACTVDATSAISKKIKKIKVRSIQESLLVFQLATCMTLIVLSILITRQYEYLQNKRLGLNPSQVVYFHSNNKHSWKNRERITNQVSLIPGVEETAMAYGGLPGTTTPSVSYKVQNTPKQWKTSYVSSNFLSLLQVDLLAGKHFDGNQKTETNSSAIINKTTASLLGWPATDIIGLTISSLESVEKEDIKIIGVVDDFHFESYQKQIEPTIFIASDFEETFVVRLAADNGLETIQQIEKVWEANVPGYPFNYHFLDDTFQRLIAEDTKQRKILYLFTGLSITIALVGILALSAYFLQTRKKELAIRTVLGASMGYQTFRVALKYFKLMLLGTLIAIPISWNLSHLWLDNFSYRITISPNIFLFGISSIILFLIFFLSIQVINSLSVNPAQTLKNE